MNFKIVIQKYVQWIQIKEIYIQMRLFLNTMYQIFLFLSLKASNKPMRIIGKKVHLY